MRFELVTTAVCKHTQTKNLRAYIYRIYIYIYYVYVSDHIFIQDSQVQKASSSF